MFTEGNPEQLVEIIHPDCRWEEDLALGWPGLDPLYSGPQGVRRWIEAVREAFVDIEAIAERVEEYDYAVVIVTRLRARASQGVEVEWPRMYNVIWWRDDLGVRRRLYADYDEAVVAANTDERSIPLRA
ncbi:MAG: hypothetical protein PVSMB1_17650 [Gemmatimonadaceae bacterium]